jgi:hypothetical protein
MRVCRPPVTYISSVHSIVPHYSVVQSKCFLAQASRLIRLISEIGGFLRVIRRENSSDLRALLIAFSE